MWESLKTASGDSPLEMEFHKGSLKLSEACGNPLEISKCTAEPEMPHCRIGSIRKSCGAQQKSVQIEGGSVINSVTKTPIRTRYKYQNPYGTHAASLLKGGHGHC